MRRTMPFSPGFCRRRLRPARTPGSSPHALRAANRLPTGPASSMRPTSSPARRGAATLRSALPGLFAESHWTPELGVTDPQSTANQVRLAVQILDNLPVDRRILLFINVSAIHQPNRFYLSGAEKDSLQSHGAALAYVDAQLPPLFAALCRRGP